MLTVALGEDWVEEIHDAQGAFTMVDGRLLAEFNGVFYSTNHADGSVLVIRDEDGQTVGYTYGIDGTLLAKNAAPGPACPNMN